MGDLGARLQELMAEGEQEKESLKALAEALFFEGRNVEMLKQKIRDEEWKVDDAKMAQAKFDAYLQENYQRVAEDTLLCKA